MKIAYNPQTGAALTAAPSNNDITFDLKGQSIYAKGVQFKGTDTTYSVFSKGYAGLVPAPSYTTATKFLKEDGTWETPLNNKVLQVNTNTNSEYRILFSNSDNNTNETNSIRKSSNLKFNPSTGTLTTNTFIGNLQGSATNLAGGVAGSIPYQTAAGTTAFLASGTSGQVLKINSSGLPQWTADDSNSGVRTTTINGNYLRVNTNGTNADLTIPYATKAAYLTTSMNTITTTTNDITSEWGVLGNSVHMYSEKNQLNNQPSQYGLLLNLAYGSDVHQIWATQSTGNLYHRGGNATGWANSSNWITILDSVNSSISGDGGSTWGSSITVKINNVEKTLTIPSNPNTDIKVAYTAATANVAHPILFANNSTNTGDPATGAVCYESNATNGAGLTYNPYSNLLNIPNGKLQINTTVKDHGTTSDQCLYIYAPAPSSGTTITTKNSPGIGFKVEGNNWGSIVFNQGVFEFVKNNFVDYHDIRANNIKANVLTSTVADGKAPLNITSTTLVNNLNADMLDGYHAEEFCRVSIHKVSFSGGYVTVSTLKGQGCVVSGDNYNSNSVTLQYNYNTPKLVITSEHYDFSDEGIRTFAYIRTYQNHGIIVSTSTTDSSGFPSGELYVLSIF